MTEKIQCPDEIVRAGVLLIATRNRAAMTREFALKSIDQVKKATEYMCQNHGAAVAQSGDAEILLSQVAAMEGAVKQAHCSLQDRMDKLNCAQPTDKQIVAMAKEMNVDLMGASWR